MQQVLFAPKSNEAPLGKRGVLTGLKKKSVNDRSSRGLAGGRMGGKLAIEGGSCILLIESGEKRLGSCR